MKGGQVALGIAVLVATCFVAFAVRDLAGSKEIPAPLYALMSLVTGGAVYIWRGTTRRNGNGSGGA